MGGSEPGRLGEAYAEGNGELLRKDKSGSEVQMTKNAEKSYLVREITRTEGKTRTVKPLRGAESSRVREFAFLDEPLYRKRKREKRGSKNSCFLFAILLRKKGELANSRTSVGTKGLHGSRSVRGSPFLSVFDY